MRTLLSNSASPSTDITSAYSNSTDSSVDNYTQQGYWVLTFNKENGAKVKMATFADVLENGRLDDEMYEEEDDFCALSDTKLSEDVHSSERNLDGGDLADKSPAASIQSECRNSLIISSPNSDSDPPKSCSPSKSTSSKILTGLSRLAAVATAARLGIDLSKLNEIVPEKTSPNPIAPYVRRYSYPDGDTRYDWLSCPLAEMQQSAIRPPLSTNPTPNPRLTSFSVADREGTDSLPFSREACVPSGRHPYLLFSGLGHSSIDSSFSRKMLRCEECGKYYRNEYSLHHHICLKRKDVWKKGDVASELIDGQVIYFCPLCSKPFKWLGNLTRHYYVHTGQRFFKCDICQKEFFSAYQVKRHMNSHTGMRFNCEICDKPFTCKYACAWHTRQHMIGGVK